MKRAVVPIALQAIDPNSGGEIKLKLSDRGIIRDVVMQVKPKVGGLITAKDPNNPPLDFIPTLMVEIDPDASEFDERKFILAPPSAIVECDKGWRLTYIGKVMYPTGQMHFIFEEEFLGIG